MGLNLKLEIPSIHQFYHESDTVEDTGCTASWETVNRRVDERWVGLSLEEIKMNKYAYTKGLDTLKKLDIPIELGGSRKAYRYDEFDGDEMNMERLYEGQASMLQRIKKIGKGNGRFVEIHVNISENWNVSATQMMCKAYTAIQLVDLLEDSGYRIKVVSREDSRNPGRYKDKVIDTMSTQVTVKDFQDPLNTPLLLTAISPWMLRYHMFKFWHAKFKMSWGLGSAANVTEEEKEQNKSLIVIESGQCLDEHSAQNFIQTVQTRFL